MFEEHRRARLCATQTSKSVFLVPASCEPKIVDLVLLLGSARVPRMGQSAARNRSRFSLHRVN